MLPFLTSAFMVLSSCVISEPDLFETGFAIVNITPAEGTVKDSVYSKAAVFRQGEEMGALVVCDIGGISREEANEVRNILRGKTSIPLKNISICATHTHSSAKCKGLTEKIAESILKAEAALQPAEISSGIARQEGVAFNRRFLMIDGTVRMNPFIDPETGTSFENGYPYLNPEIVRPVGPTDPDLPAVVFTNKDDNTPMGALSCFAMHTCVYGEGISADFPGFMADEMKKNFDDHFISIFGEGASGDINHWDVSKPGEGQNGPQRSEEIGRELASTIIKDLPEFNIQEPDFKVMSKIVYAPLNMGTKMDIEWARSAHENNFKDFAPTGFNNRGFLAKVRAQKILRVEELEREGLNPLPLEVIVYKLSKETAIVTLPGEVFVELALSIKEQSPFKNTMVIELSNVDAWYIPTLKAYSEGGYEVVISLTAPGTGEILVDTAVEMLKELGSKCEV